MDPLNRTAIEIVDEAVDFADELRIAASDHGGGTLIDAGLDAPGGNEAGVLVAEIATAGLATIDTHLDSIGECSVPHVTCSTDHAGLALHGSASPDWALGPGVASGPAAALAGRGGFADLGYSESFDLATVVLEADERPPEDVVQVIADATDVPESGVYVVLVPPASLAGSVLGVARAGGRAVSALLDDGVDADAIRSVSSTAPVPPAEADAGADTAMRHAGSVHLALDPASVGSIDLATVANDAGLARVAVSTGGSIESAGAVDADGFRSAFGR